MDAILGIYYVLISAVDTTIMRLMELNLHKFC